MKKFFAEFKEFISRGDVVSMAVGIIVGSTFTAIVNSLVKDIITPFIGVLMGGANFSELAWTIGEAQIMYGSFIQAVINFLITAFVLFCVVKAMNTLKQLGEKKKAEEEAAKAAEPAAPAPTPEDIVLLTEIRDLLKK
jgi:large conductance mechanosensitive channel